MNINNRRKVKYRLISGKPGFDPEKSDEELKKEMEMYEGYDGWFHTWTQDSIQDPKSDNILIVTNGIIETSEGELLSLPFNWFKFMDNE